MVSLPEEEVSSSGRSQSGLVLPVHRIKMIMKSCPDVESVQQESLHIVARATELFIMHLAQESYKTGGEGRRLDYDALSEMVQANPKLEFLMETVPNKITWEHCQRLMAEKQTKIDALV